MSNALDIINGVKTISSGRHIMDHLNLSIPHGEFVTILGGNGAGKSTLFNVISGQLFLTSGKVELNGEDVTNQSEENRAKYIARVFQDPKLGTAPRMTVSENLLLAQLRGKKRGLKKRQLAQQKEFFFEQCQKIGNGLENHLDTPTGNLSGGQRQALSLLMATIQKPDLLLLDEHTAALDPKTSRQLMDLTEKTISENNLTCLMITHRMEDALKYGNRLIVLDSGQVQKDMDETQKNQLELADLLTFFNL
ncbi:ABC transporter ATP-binding protein [Vagococcus bubulae]|uniref:ABC transporter ATP-binding protein n=1 Tax=Vagococcus bubulae TaxID=1977868 RepID=A0A429ZRJ4_9ENTE|nr:ATP-binding cassette domain-containing protein [Vagococcus bubulae]RST96291.1 ABC transporter ATP-binding protein [Vagococcus bubulae]